MPEFLNPALNVGGHSPASQEPRLDLQEWLNVWSRTTRKPFTSRCLLRRRCRYLNAFPQNPLIPAVLAHRRRLRRYLAVRWLLS